jgi:dolichol-phosphate mannosyltransferase
MVGFALQLAIVFALTAAGVNYLIATGLAVELAILHNFVWHELYTWRDTRATSAAAVAGRLLLFNVSTAVVSITGNVILTALLVELLHVVPAVANALAVAVLSIVNYTVASRWVFLSRSPCRRGRIRASAIRAGPFQSGGSIRLQADQT